jgi:uncharacterized protein (DUF2141 family)
MDMKRVIVVLAGLATMGAASPPPGDLKVELNGLRSAKGVVHLCLTANQQQFLTCKDDPAAVARTIPAAKAGSLDLGLVKPGTYALLIVHDENNNGRLDMTMGIPREGFGFSNNPAMRPRAPRWEEIRFTMPQAALTQQVRIRYVL